MFNAVLLEKSGKIRALELSQSGDLIFLCGAGISLFYLGPVISYLCPCLSLAKAYYSNCAAYFLKHFLVLLLFGMHGAAAELLLGLSL